MDAVATEMLRIAILGPVVVALAIYTWKLHRENRDLQKENRECHEKRVADAQQVTEKVLQLNDRWNQTIGTFSALMTEQKTAAAEVREALRELLRQRVR